MVVQVPQIVSLDVSGCQIKKIAARAFQQVIILIIIVIIIIVIIVIMIVNIIIIVSASSMITAVIKVISVWLFFDLIIGVFQIDALEKLYLHNNKISEVKNMKRWYQS